MHLMQVIKKRFRSYIFQIPHSCKLLPHKRSEGVSMSGAATSIIFVATNTCLTRQNTSFALFCCDKSFFSRQAYFCREKHVFVATKDVFCRDKRRVLSLQKMSVTMLVATKVCLSRQTLSSSLKMGRRYRKGNQRLCVCVCVCVFPWGKKHGENRGLDQKN